MANEGEEGQPKKSDSSGETSTSQQTAAMPLFNSASEFSALCKSLSMPVDIQKKAEGVLDTVLAEVDQHHDLEMTQTDMFVCALYMALIDARMPYGPHDPQLKNGYLAAPPVTITQLLQAANTSVKQLLQRMRQVKGVLLPSEAVVQHFSSLEENVCIMGALAHTFDRLCAGVFREEDSPHNEENIPSLPETEGVTFRKKLCWLLFIHAKHRIMGDNLDLFRCFLVLLCCLEYVMRTTPSFLLNSPYDVIRIGCLHTAEQGSLPMLNKLCQQFDVDKLEETEDLCRNCMEPFFQEFNRDGELDTDALEESYLKQHAEEGDLNELLFLTKDPIVSPSILHSRSASNGQSDQPPMTPVRATLNSIQQLKNALATATDEPSDKLKDYFQICPHSPAAAISERVVAMRGLFVSKFEAATSPYQSVADPRFTLGVKLYYRMLELLLNNDSERRSVTVMDLDTLLNKDNFHTSLLACSLEVVLFAYGLTRSYAVNGGDSEVSPFVFPWILDTLSIQAYDFLKVLESFIRAEPRLPTDVVKHLQNIEYRILESLAWKEGSSLFEVIRVCERGTATPPRTSPADPLTNTTNQLCPSTAQMFLSPVPPRPATTSTTTGQTTTALVTVPRRSQSLTAFFNKVYRLAYFRLTKLCGHLQVTSEIVHKIWTCFENCVTYRPDILKNRHLDQMLMCSVYGVCRVLERDIRFKTITQEYKNIPSAQPSVFRAVYMTEGKYDSIINFYNQIFMVNMKTCILQFASSSRQAAATLSPLPHPVSPQPSSPAYSVMGRKNFLVSPLKESPFKAPRSPSQLTPASRQLFCFGDRPGSAEQLRNINASMTAANKRRGDLAGLTQPKEKVRRLIHFDQPPEESLLNSSPKK